MDFEPIKKIIRMAKRPFGVRIAKLVGLPLISLGIAIILWLYAVGEQSVEVTLKIPLVMKPSVTEMTVIKSSVPDIMMRLSVPRHLLSVVNYQSVKAAHEIKDVGETGIYNFRLNSRDITLPPGNIRIIDIWPEVVTVTLDRLVTERLLIHLRLEDDPAEGYEVETEKIRLDPNAVLVRGPYSKMKELQSVETEPLSLVGRTRPFRRKVRLDLDPDLKAVTSGLLIDAFVPIRREAVTVTYRDVTVKLLGNPKDLSSSVSFKPEMVTFTLKGPKMILDQLSPESVVPFIDSTGLEKGEHELPLQFKLPAEVVLDGQSPIIKIKIK